MSITFYSLITTFLWTSILFLLLFFCRRSIWFINSFGIQVLLVLFGCSLFRLFVAIEFPSVTVVRIPQILNPMYDFFHLEIKGISIFLICTLTWFTTSVVLLLRLIGVYRHYIKYLKQLPTITTAQIDRIAKSVISDKKVKITLSSATCAPLVCGFWHGLILLPEVDYSDQELQVILEHEYAHIQNHDGYIRLMTEIFCALNPLVYLIKHELDNILELKCDARVIEGKTEDEIIFYGETLIKFAHKATDNPIPFTTAEFSEFATMKQRMKLLFSTPRHLKPLSVLISFMLIGTLLLSYFFVFQSYYCPSEIETVPVAFKVTENLDGSHTVFFTENGTKFSYIISSEEKNRMEAESALP